MDRNKNLLIVGAGIYGLVAKEIAESLDCFDKICFVDDCATKAPNGIEVIGKTSDVEKLSSEFANIIVAIGNAEIRLKVISKIEKTSYKIVSLVSPKSYLSPSAQIGVGCIIEPMAVIHTGCVIEKGCIISAGSVINHASKLCEGVHIDCNATIEGYTVVPEKTKISAGKAYKGNSVKPEDIFLR